MRNLVRLFPLIVLAAPFLASCGGSGSSPPPPPPPPPNGGPPPPPPPPPDLSGTWFMQSSGTVDTCGRGIWLDGWATVVTQNADAAEFLNSDGSTFSGTVGETTLQLSGSFPEPASPFLGLPAGTVGDATIDMKQLTIDAASDVLFGSMDWQWVYMDPGGGGQVSCDGSSQFYLRRDGQEQEVEPNDDAPSAQALNIIANDNGVPQNSTAGWVTGSVDLLTDEFDVFQFTIANRSRLEIELSHFDPAAEDLDIAVGDAALNLLAFSDSGDSFEMLEVDLDPGTYYIEIEAFFTAAPATYIMSIDLNEI